MLPDILFRRDIETLINRFYERVRADEVIGFIFNDVAKVDWPAHLPVMYDFWEFLLLGGDNYRRNPIQPHFDLHARHPLAPEHFDRWLQLFETTVDELFAGPKADDAKARARAIVGVWKPKFSKHGL